jgi:hypothetical protein
MDNPCTRRNGCLDGFHRLQRVNAQPIARRLGRGNLLGIMRKSGYPPDAINGPVNRLLTDIPPPPAFRPADASAVIAADSPAPASDQPLAVGGPPPGMPDLQPNLPQYL